MSDNHVFRFGDFELDLRAERLTRQGVEVRLAPQPMRVLGLLVQRQGGLVTRDELHALAWGGRHVSFDQALNFAIARLRHALGDEGPTWQFIETVPRRGYRFAAPLVVAGSTRIETVPHRWHARTATWVALAAVAFAIAVSAAFPRDPAVVIHVLPSVADVDDASIAERLRREISNELTRRRGRVSSGETGAAYTLGTRVDRADAGVRITATLVATGADRPRWRASVVAARDEIANIGRDLAADVHQVLAAPGDGRTVTIER